MTIEYAAWVDPATLGEYEEEGPWCRACGFRADRSPLSGGCDCYRPCAIEDPAARTPVPVSGWPAEIVMEGGPNIIVHSQQEHDAVRAAMRNNARLDRQGQQ